MMWTQVSATSVLVSVIVLTLVLALVAGTSFMHLVFSYRRMLERDEPAWWMTIIGRRNSSVVCKKILSLASIFPSGYETQLAEDAKAKVASLSNLPDASARGGVVFVGSSTFTYWHNIQQDVAEAIGVPVLNAAFGGAHTGVLLPILEELVVRHQPAVVVYFAGTNDLLMGRTPEEAARGFSDARKYLSAKLPDAFVIYLGITCTPLHRSLGNAEKIERANDLVKVELSQCASAADFFAFDLAAASEQLENLYLHDMHHLNAEGHRLLASALVPVIRSHLAGAAA